MKGSILLLFVLIFPSACAFISYAIGLMNEKFRDWFNIIVMGINFAAVNLLYIPLENNPIDISISYVMGTGLHLRLDVFRYIFVWITSFITFLITIYSTQYLTSYKNRNRYYLFFLITMSSTIGIFISENFLNLFTFFEIMSLCSYALIIHDEDDYSHDAGDTYIVMAVAGGLILLLGLALLYNYTQTLEISKLYSTVEGLGKLKYLIGSLILIGFGVKAGMIPLHIWLPKAHPAAPAPASAILSGILLKTGIFGIILTVDIMLREDFYFSVIIMVIGFMNMLTGGFLAMFQRNIKRILAYSSMSQIGYILVGIGLVGILKEHSQAAIYGTIFHIINHAVFKVLLFLSAGVIYMELHELSINKIGGFGIGRYPLMILFAIGTFAITGVPGFNGYVGKTLLHEALLEAHNIYHTNWLTVGEGVFTLSSSFTVAYLLKIFAAVFIEKSNNTFKSTKDKMNKVVMVPMMVLSAIIIYIGLSPNFVMHMLAGAVKTFGEENSIEFHILSFSALKSSVITFLFGVVIYIVLIRGLLRKGEGVNWYYINPALKWFSLEKHIYSPIARVTVQISIFILRFIDGALIGTAEFFSGKIQALGKLEVDYKESILHLIKERYYGLSRYKNKEIGKNISNKKVRGSLSVKARIENISYLLNSVTYTIFLFAAALVVCLLVLIYFSKL